MKLQILIPPAIEPIDIESLGFMVMSTDPTIVAPNKDYDTIVYPEWDDVEIFPQSTLSTFTYTCKLAYKGDSPSGITDFISLVRNKRITLYNHNTGMKVSGYLAPTQNQEYYRRIICEESLCFTFDFCIFVAEPSTLQPI
jgi:hypothetical protein